MKRPRNRWTHRARRALGRTLDRLAETFARVRRPVVITAVYGMTNPAISANAVRAACTAAASKD